jgi:hypothetical protein
MQEIVDWLRGLSFEQYTRCFAENNIDFRLYVISVIKISTSNGPRPWSTN